MANLKVGDRIINESGTCLRIVDAIEGETPKPGTVAAADVSRYVAAGYRLVEDGEEIPVQQWQIDAERGA